MSRLFLFYLFILFFSCAGRVSNGVKIVKPDWLVTRPNDDVNWYGVGSINKDKNIDYKSVARLRAVSEIAEQIKVNIKSKLVDIVEANDDLVNEFSSSIIESRVEVSLDFIEYLDSYITSDGQYHVVAKLSREKYFKKLAVELQKAEIRSANLIESAISDINGSSFKKLSQAMDEIDPYLDLNPKMIFPQGSGKKEAIYDIISKLIYDYNNRIKIVADPKKIVFTPLLDSKKEFALQVFDKTTNKPISNISLVMSASFLDAFDTLVTDQVGSARFILPDYLSGSSKYKASFNLEFSDVENAQAKRLMEISSLVFPLNIKIINPALFIEDDILNLGEKIANKLLVNKVKTFFENSFSAVFVSSLKSSDLILTVNIRTQKRRERLNNNFPYIVYASGGISLSRRADKVEIKNIQFSEQKGSDFDSESLAGADAINKIEKELELSFNKSQF